MASDKVHVCLEIGTTKVCAIVAECRRDGEMRILGIGDSPSRGVRKGEIIDFKNASQCVHDALADAEDRSDHEIKSVWLAVTGAHMQGFNAKSSLTLPEESEITEAITADIEAKARESGIPRENSIIHSIIQRYYVDGQEGVVDPHGMMGRKIEAHYHMIHGVETRIHNAMRCVRDFDIEVEEIVVNSMASAQAVLDDQQKKSGVAVIDIGGGITDYIVYLDGQVSHTGVIAIGGDHITNDLCIGLRIPIARAEKLKIEEGSATSTGVDLSEKITLKNDTGFSGKDIDRAMLNMIIEARLRELFTIIHKRINEVVPEHLLGAGILLTGGVSLTRGIREVAESVFHGTPVHLAHARTESGPMSAFENPQLSTCIGIAKYAQNYYQQLPDETIFGKLKNMFAGKFGIL